MKLKQPKKLPWSVNVSKRKRIVLRKRKMRLKKRRKRRNRKRRGWLNRRSNKKRPRPMLNRQTLLAKTVKPIR